MAELSHYPGKEDVVRGELGVFWDGAYNDDLGAAICVILMGDCVLGVWVSDLRRM